MWHLPLTRGGIEKDWAPELILHGVRIRCHARKVPRYLALQCEDANLKHLA